MKTQHLLKPKTQAAMNRIGNVMANHIAPTFQAGALVTVIVRFPGEPECDFFMSDRAETIAELRAFLDRCDKRDQLDHATTAGVNASLAPQPLRDGWHIMIGAGKDGFGAYAVNGDTQVCLAVFDPKDYPDARVSGVGVPLTNQPKDPK